ncbi:MAG: AAA family ATPase, partial [Candidatus Gastranaerophilales bacterium]|nr:AAA family ATPase [Candidatus Gastranaerophilales bacterium]
MITKFIQLRKIGKFSNIIQEKNFKNGSNNDNCNIIFGFNGSGKTTLSNALSFFGNNSFITEEEKLELFNDIKNDTSSSVEILLQNNSPIKYPANSPHNKNFFIFNSNFITTHIFNGTKGQIKKFSNISGEITNKEITNINKEIEKLEKEKEQLDREISHLDDSFNSIKKELTNDFNKNISGKRLIIPKITELLLPENKIENLEINLKKLYIDYNYSKNQTDLD